MENGQVATIWKSAPLPQSGKHSKATNVRQTYHSWEPGLMHIAVFWDVTLCELM